MIQRQRAFRLRRAGHWILDHPWYLLLVLGVVLFVRWVVSTRTEPYIVKAAFTTGFNLVTGLPVDVNGVQVGKIASVRYDGTVVGGEAIVSVGITDPAYIPLHRGTTVEARWGSTIGNGTRRLDVNPGPPSAPRISNGGIIETRNTLPAQDVDQELNIFTPGTRRHLTGMLGNLQQGLQGQAPALHAAIGASPAALDAANGVLLDLGKDTYALRGLVVNGDTLTSVLASRAPAISDLVTVAGQTFSTMAAHASGLQQSIADLPGALSEARGTLARLDVSVGVVRNLLTEIRPGAAQLAPLATALDPTLASLRSLVPTAVATVEQATAAAPSITRLLAVATPFMPKLQSVSSQLAPMVACMRPYAPEAGGAIVGAGSWMSTYTLEKPKQGIVTFTGKANGPFVEQHGVRAMPELSLASNHAYVPGTISTAAFTSLAGKQFAEPRPPGLSVGQPWYQPQCGAPASSINPSFDPENPTR